ncbi:MAG: hypothetical protein Q4D06_05530 [Coriobacteriia bacterium]|nr:hypothetical protein [Coriobacteriia bacterium]
MTMFARAGSSMARGVAVALLSLLAAGACVTAATTYAHAYSMTVSGAQATISDDGSSSNPSNVTLNGSLTSGGSYTTMFCVYNSTAYPVKVDLVLNEPNSAKSKTFSCGGKSASGGGNSLYLYDVAVAAGDFELCQVTIPSATVGSFSCTLTVKNVRVESSAPGDVLNPDDVYKGYAEMNAVEYGDDDSSSLGYGKVWHKFNLYNGNKAKYAYDALTGSQLTLLRDGTYPAVELGWGKSYQIIFSGVPLSADQAKSFKDDDKASKVTTLSKTARVKQMGGIVFSGSSWGSSLYDRISGTVHNGYGKTYSVYCGSTKLSHNTLGEFTAKGLKPATKYTFKIKTHIQDGGIDYGTVTTDTVTKTTPGFKTPSVKAAKVSASKAVVRVVIPKTQNAKGLSSFKIYMNGKCVKTVSSSSLSSSKNAYSYVIAKSDAGKATFKVKSICSKKTSVYKTSKGAKPTANYRSYGYKKVLSNYPSYAVGYRITKVWYKGSTLYVKGFSFNTHPYYEYKITRSFKVRVDGKLVGYKSVPTGRLYANRFKDFTFACKGSKLADLRHGVVSVTSTKTKEIQLN